MRRARILAFQVTFLLMRISYRRCGGGSTAMFIELHLYIDRRGADRRVGTEFGSCPAY